VLILSTSNFLVSAMAMSSIIGIMLTCFGIMALLGWSISILESICMIIVVGMAVDYTVHLMHSYNEAHSPDRFGKAQTALTEMGVSVISGALTTLFASMPLLLAQFKFFTQFGSFIAIITFCSILWAIPYLMTLAMCIGPEGEGHHLFCDIKPVKFWLRCKRIPKAHAPRAAPRPAGGEPAAEEARLAGMAPRVVQVAAKDAANAAPHPSMML